MQTVRLRMKQPLLPLRQRLLTGTPLAVAWLVLLGAMALRTEAWLLIPAVLVAGVQFWMWVFGPNGHEPVPKDRGTT